jgi:hypothetical protein
MVTLVDVPVTLRITGPRLTPSEQKSVLKVSMGQTSGICNPARSERVGNISTSLP